MNVGGASAPRLYKEALAWLYRLERFGIKLGLENIRRLLDKLHVDPYGAGLVLHVAGTNGKGSVCAIIDAIARSGGYATGLFTSPHLITFRERIRTDGEMISEDAVARGLTKIRDLVRGWNPHPTFFEVTTALALKHFADAKIDIVILETGLGGRLDATNAVRSNVAVITPIDLDHEKWLGQSIREIAAEKAGIIKSKTSVVSAPQQPAAAEVICARADECAAPLQFVNDQYERSPIALRGPHQKQNAALAIGALRAAKIDIDESAIARGLLAIDWPARFQLWDERTVIDGAHNPAAAHVLAETWREVFGDQPATLILAILSDKDLHGICEVLAPISDFVLLPKIRGERAAEPSEIAQVLASVCGAGASPAGNRSGCPTISLAPSIADALEAARAKSNPILITGSLHFAGEALAHLRGESAAFEECAQ